MPDLIVERADGVVRATLNRPDRKNAITLELFDALRSLCDEVDANDADRALVLKGVPGAFSSGADLGDRGGAGMSLALGCDIVIASTRARFSAIFVRRGLSIDFGLSWLLPRIVGAAKAKELSLLGDFVDANEALRIGLVSRVVNPDELDHAVEFVVHRLATGPTLAIRRDVELLQASFARTFEEAIAAECEAQAANLQTDDAREAIAAFLEKRDAEFKGR